MNIVDRARNIILSPNTEWNVISAETPQRNQIIVGYVIPLAGLAAIAAFIGYGFIGVSAFGVKFVGLDWGLFQAISKFISALLSVFITALVLDTLAPNFNSQKNFDRSLQLVAYAFTPVWIGDFLAIFPPLAIIGTLFGIYGLYLMYIGIPKLKFTPEDKHVGYFVVCIIVTVIVYIAIGWILNSVLMNSFGLVYSAGNGLNGPAY